MDFYNILAVPHSSGNDDFVTFVEYAINVRKFPSESPVAGFFLCCSFVRFSMLDIWYDL